MIIRYRLHAFNFERIGDVTSADELGGKISHHRDRLRPGDEADVHFLFLCLLYVCVIFASFHAACLLHRLSRQDRV